MKFGVLDAFASVDTPVVSGFVTEAGIGANITVNGVVVGGALGFKSKEITTDIVRVIQAAMSLVVDEEKADLAMAMLSMFATKSYVLPTPDEDDSERSLWEDNEVTRAKEERAGM